MLNKLAASMRELEILTPGVTVNCAVSGGADSVALLFGLYLLRQKLGIHLAAAHFNHHLRGAESDEDEQFVRDFCARYDIPLLVGGARVKAGEKGLEAAAREARYAFLRGLPGLVATAHTADDNAETVLMHLLRGTGLKGLGAIAPVNGGVIRPMLNITRREVEAFLEEYALPHREDSSNATDQFLRNRIRHDVMPLLLRENPVVALGLSAMAQRLRRDEDYLQAQLDPALPGVEVLRHMHPALRARYLERFLKDSHIPEPEQAHIAMAEALVFSDKPSAQANFPGGVTLARNYDRLELRPCDIPPQTVEITGTTDLPQWGIRLVLDKTPIGFGVTPVGTLVVRSRQAGDTIRLPGGTKTLKKRMIDQKIPAFQRSFVPVIADDSGVLYVYGIGPNLDRMEESPTVYLRVECLSESERGEKTWKTIF